MVKNDSVPKTKSIKFSLTTDPLPLGC